MLRYIQYVDMLLCMANAQSMLCVLHPLKVCNEQYQCTLIAYSGVQSIAQDLHI